MSVFSYILSFIANLISGIGSMWSLPQNVYNTINVVVGYTMMFDGIIPIRTIYTAFYTILAFEIVLLIIKTILMIINWSRGSGSINIE